MYGWIGGLGAAFAALFIRMKQGGNVYAVRWTAATLRNELERIECMLLDGDLSKVEAALQEIGQPIEHLKAPDAAELRVRHGLIYAELAYDAGRRDLARPIIDRAREQLDGVAEESLRLDLDAWATALGWILLAAESVTPRELERTRAALERDGSERGDLRVRLAWASHWMGLVEQGRGHWDRARAALERAVAIAERIERPGTGLPRSGASLDLRERWWSAAHACGSSAALLLGEVALSIQHRDEARAWYERSVALLEGATLPRARLGRARALLSRAIHEPLDELERERRRPWLEAVIAEATIVDAPEGWGFAGRAAIELGGHDSRLGLHDAARGHWERAVQFAANADPEGQRVLAALARIELAQHHEERGALDAAKQCLREVFEENRTEGFPESRRLAVDAACRLHGVLLAEGAHDDATALLDAAETVLPTLVFEARPPLVALLARARGIQLARHGEHDEATASLERAAELATELGGSGGARLGRWIAADLGHACIEREMWSEAYDHMARALEACPRSGEDDERADLVLCLAQVLMQLDREPEAQRRLDEAFRLGSGSGTSRGRENAAAAHLLRADLGDDAIALRRSHYESAARLGRLSGRPRGREIAERAEMRLREMV